MHKNLPLKVSLVFLAAFLPHMIEMITTNDIGYGGTAFFALLVGIDLLAGWILFAFFTGRRNDNIPLQYVGLSIANSFWPYSIGIFGMPVYLCAAMLVRKLRKQRVFDNKKEAVLFALTAFIGLATALPLTKFPFVKSIPAEIFIIAGFLTGTIYCLIVSLTLRTRYCLYAVMFYNPYPLPLWGGCLLGACVGFLIKTVFGKNKEICILRRSIFLKALGDAGIMLLLILPLVIMVMLSQVIKHAYSFLAIYLVALAILGGIIKKPYYYYILLCTMISTVVLYINIGKRDLFMAEFISYSAREGLLWALNVHAIVGVPLFVAIRSAKKLIEYINARRTADTIGVEEKKNPGTLVVPFIVITALNVMVIPLLWVIIAVLDNSFFIADETAVACDALATFLTWAIFGAYGIISTLVTRKVRMPIFSALWGGAVHGGMLFIVLFLIGDTSYFAWVKSGGFSLMLAVLVLPITAVVISAIASLITKRVINKKLLQQLSVGNKA